jgi:MFS family permease
VTASDPLTVRQTTRRFLMLRALRWLPTGLLIPVVVLLLLERGLTLGQIGLVAAAQGVVVMLLELPSGGLADSFGRRRVLLLAAVFELAATSLLVVASTLPVLAVVFALQGIYRALESGPLDAWYVDAVQAADPEADIETGFSRGGVALGLAIAAGTVLSSILVAIDPLPAVSPLVTPLLLALALRLVETASIAGLMVEMRDVTDPLGFVRTLRGVPAVVGDAVRLVRASHVVLALMAVEFLWGAGMVAFELFTPARLAEILGDAGTAATVIGPANAIGWLASASAAAVVPVLVRRVGPSVSGTILLAVQAATVVGIGLATGVVGVVAAYLATMAVHGAANPVHSGLLHRAVTDPSRRATVLSANSMTGHMGNAVSGIALGALADAAGLGPAVVAGAALLAVAAPLYLLTARRRPTPAGRGVHPP